MLKTYEVTFTIEATSSKDIEKRLNDKGYIWLPNTTIRESVPNECPARYHGRTVTIVDPNKVHSRTGIEEHKGYSGKLLKFEDGYELETSSSWEFEFWHIYGEHIELLLELGAIAITS